MSVTLVYSGSLPGAFPGPATLQAAFVANIEREIIAATTLLADLSIDLPELEASLDVTQGLLANIQANVADPTLIIKQALAYSADAMATLVLAAPGLAASLTAQLDVQVAKVADLSAKVALKATKIAEVKVRLGLLKAALDLAKSFDLQQQGVRVYTFTGPIKDTGLIPPDQTDGIPPTTPVYLTAIVTDSPLANEAIKKLVKAV